MEKQAHKNASSDSGRAPARSVLYGVGVALIILGIGAALLTTGWPSARSNAASISAPEEAQARTNVSEITSEIAAGHAWNAETNAVLIYSDTCPHCHALINYLEEKNAFKEMNIVKTTDPSPYIPLLAKMGINFSGVPTFIIYAPEMNIPSGIKTAPFIVIVGFPSDYQNKDGYFMGREKELEYCQGMHGTPYYENNIYLFCVLPDGTVLGNEHAIDWILQHT